MFEFKQGAGLLEKYLDILKTCHLFDGLSEAEIQDSLSCIESRRFHAAKNSYILRAGENTEAIGLILSGSALITQEDLWGNRNIMTLLSPGDFFAEAFALLPDEVLSINVVVAEDCEILNLSVSRLLTTCSPACAHHSRLIQNLITALAKKTLLFNDKITHMSKRKTRDKLLSYLSAEALRQGSLSFDIPYNRQQLADFLCVERAAMSVELSRLQKEGLIRTERSHFDLQPGFPAAAQ